MENPRVNGYVPPERTADMDLVRFANIYDSLFRKEYNISPDNAIRKQLVEFAQKLSGIFSSYQEYSRKSSIWKTPEGGIEIKVE
jgi:exonuclease V gamma subunit